MILETSLLDIGGSIFARVPPAMVKFYRIRDKEFPGKCTIEDVGPNQAKITFECE